MTKFPLRMLMRFQEWFEAHLIRWRPAHLELEGDTDEQLKDVGLEPLKRNFTTLKPLNRASRLELSRPLAQGKVRCQAPQ
jgi:hypothetical protein